MLLHLALESDWDADASTYPISTRGLTVDQVGFMHCCSSLAQLDGVVERFYSDVTEPLLVLDLDEPGLIAAGFEVRHEPGVPDDPGSELFPHVYGGPVPTRFVTGVRPYARA